MFQSYRILPNTVVHFSKHYERGKSRSAGTLHPGLPKSLDRTVAASSWALSASRVDSVDFRGLQELGLRLHNIVLLSYDKVGTTMGRFSSFFF